MKLDKGKMLDIFKNCEFDRRKDGTIWVTYTPPDNNYHTFKMEYVSFIDEIIKKEELEKFIKNV